MSLEFNSAALSAFRKIDFGNADAAADKSARQFARHFPHIPRPKVVRNADALAVVRFWFNTRICSRLTTLTFRGHGNLPRKPTRPAAKMV